MKDIKKGILTRGLKNRFKTQQKIRRKEGFR
jgi:hypothetical protein